MRIIRVTGKGQIKVKPDMTRITITLDGLVYTAPITASARTFNRTLPLFRPHLTAR